MQNTLYWLFKKKNELQIFSFETPELELILRLEKELILSHNSAATIVCVGSVYDLRRYGLGNGLFGISSRCVYAVIRALLLLLLLHAHRKPVAKCEFQKTVKYDF